MSTTREKVMASLGIDPKQPWGLWVRKYPSSGHQWHRMRDAYTTLCGRAIDLHTARSWVPPQKQACRRRWTERMAAR